MVLTEVVHAIGIAIDAATPTAAAVAIGGTQGPRPIHSVDRQFDYAS